MNSKAKLTCWIVSDPKAGMINQCLALANILPCTYEVKKVGLQKIWQFLTPFVRLPYSWIQSGETDRITLPWPDLIITCGRQAFWPAVWIRRQSQGKTKLVKLQDPQTLYSECDLIVTPWHDRLSEKKRFRYLGGRKEQIFETLGGLHTITPKSIEQAAFGLKDQISKLTQKKNQTVVTLILGGKNKIFDFSKQELERILEVVEDLHQRYQPLFLVTNSRRTPPEFYMSLQKTAQDKGMSAVFYDVLSESKSLSFLDGKTQEFQTIPYDQNPYHPFLGLGDYIFITQDSISMVTEAIATFKPVYLLELARNSKVQRHKFNKFYEIIRHNDYVRTYQGELQTWSHLYVNDLEQVAQRVMTFFK